MQESSDDFQVTVFWAVRAEPLKFLPIITTDISWTKLWPKIGQSLPIEVSVITEACMEEMRWNEYEWPDVVCESEPDMLVFVRRGAQNIELVTGDCVTPGMCAPGRILCVYVLRVLNHMVCADF